MKLKLFLSFISILTVFIIALAFYRYFNKPVLVGGGEVKLILNTSCVSLISNEKPLNQSDMVKAQDCIRMMIESIQTGGYKIGNQGTESIQQTIDKKRLVKYYQQRISAISLDSSNKLIQKATDAQILQAPVEEIIE